MDLFSLYAVTIIGGAIGEWNYYILGSLIEAALLVGVVYYAWTWPKVPDPDSGSADQQLSPREQLQS